MVIGSFLICGWVLLVDVCLSNCFCFLTRILIGIAIVQITVDDISKRINLDLYHGFRIVKKSFGYILIKLLYQIYQ